MSSLLRSVQLFAMDVDGVLTDGGLLYNGVGEETKRFHVADGLGLQLVRLAGIEVAWISGRRSPAVERRAHDIKVPIVLQGVHDKAAALAGVAVQRGLPAEAIAFMGDDLNDLPAFAVAGVRLAPSNAVALVKRAADYVTVAAGGAGAVREACDRILEAQGRLEGATAAYIAGLLA